MSSNIITFPRFALHDWKSCLFRDLFEELLLLLFSFPFYPSLFSLIFRHDARSFFLCWWKYNQSHFEFLTFSSHKQDRIRMASGYTWLLQSKTWSLCNFHHLNSKYSFMSVVTCLQLYCNHNSLSSVQYQSPALQHQYAVGFSTFSSFCNAKLNFMPKKSD